MRRSAIVLVAVIAFPACGGASKLSEAPRAADTAGVLCDTRRGQSRGRGGLRDQGNYPKTFFAMTTGSRRSSSPTTT
jgi:hypothetical protein